jgi:hypothetical protein
MRLLFWMTVALFLPKANAYFGTWRAAHRDRMPLTTGLPDIVRRAQDGSPNAPRQLFRPFRARLFLLYTQGFALGSHVARLWR